MDKILLVYEELQFVCNSIAVTLTIDLLMLQQLMGKRGALMTKGILEYISQCMHSNVLTPVA